MANLSLVVTITRREVREDYLRYLHANNVYYVNSVLCEGTAQQMVLDHLGIEKTDKVMLSSLVSSSACKELLHGLISAMRIDAPGNGIAFSAPLSGAVPTPTLQRALKDHENQMENGVNDMGEENFRLITAIVKKGHTGMVMDAARAAGAGGGTVVHGKGLSREQDAHFFGMSFAEEQDLLLILAKKEDEKPILRAIMDSDKSHPGTVIAAYSQPVTQVVGVHRLTE